MRFELDCAATMFALGRNKRRNYLIRLSATLYEAVEKEILQAALKKTIEKYPYFFIRFRSVQNQLFAQPAEYIPEVREKKNVSRLELWENHESCEAQVTYCGNTIFLEYFHAVSDGKGGMEFLMYLTAEYLSMRYHDERILQSVPVIPKDKQLENGYRKFAKGFRTKKSHGAAFQIKGTPAVTRISSYCISVCEIKQTAKKYKVSVTEFVAALLCKAIANVQKENCGKSRQKKIRLLIPVNLRTRFPCDTIRNFTLNVCPEVKPEESVDLPGICIKFHQYMKAATTQEQLAGQCAMAAKTCDSGLIKLLPVSVKKCLVQTALDLPLTGSSMTFSNMGAALWPEELKAHVDELEMVFSAKPETPYSCSAISVGDKMRLSFLRTIREPLLEAQFEKVLCELGNNFKKLEFKPPETAKDSEKKVNETK